MVLEIPQISDERLSDLAVAIRPVYRLKGSLVFMRYPKSNIHLRTRSFLWAPKPAGRALALEQICVLNTLHTWNYYGIFKPSIAEVLAQIPNELTSVAVAFETIGPADAAELNTQHEALHAGFHVARTILYRSALQV